MAEALPPARLQQLAALEAEVQRARGAAPEAARAERVEPEVPLAMPSEDLKATTSNLGLRDRLAAKLFTMLAPLVASPLVSTAPSLFTVAMA